MGYWLIVIFILLSPLPIQGHEACHDDSMEYHSLTHSCFLRVETKKSWINARDHCSQQRSGSKYGVIMRLAKIDDENTNDFVKSLVSAENGSWWIGLHYMSEKVAFRWDGYPHEMPIFTESNSNWSQPTRPYVTITASGWRGEYSDQSRQFICQQQAKKISTVACELQVQTDALNITCTSGESPSKANCLWTYKYKSEINFRPWRHVTSVDQEEITGGGNISYETTCSDTLRRDNANIKDGTVQFKIKMYPHIAVPHISTNELALTFGTLDIVIAHPQKATFALSDKNVAGQEVIVVQGSDNVTLDCKVLTGSPAVHLTVMSCDSTISNEDNQANQRPEAYSLVIGEVKREMDGKTCVCRGYHVTGTTEDSILTFKVVSKVKDVTCQSELHPKALMVSCEIGKIYPQAVCDFSSRHPSDLGFNPMPVTDITRYSNQSYYDVDGFLYYTSSCSLTWTSDTMTFTPGNLTIHVLINPNIEGIDKDIANDAFITAQESVKIVLPDKPQLRMIGGTTLEESSLELCFEDNPVKLSCEINSGNPLVHSVTLSCEFSLSDTDEGNEHTENGTALVFNKRASRDMHGKSCTCIGNHLTGLLHSSPLNFIVMARPSDVACVSYLRPNGLFVTCRIGKIYPEASCKWSYLNDNDLYFTPVPENVIIEYDHESYVDADGFMFYKSNCSITLTPDIVNFRAGSFTVQVTMNPNFEGVDKDTMGDAFQTTQKVIKIEVPEKPSVRAFYKTSEAWSASPSSDGKMIFLLCEVKSGQPAVHSVTISCEFPITDLGEEQITIHGTSYVIHKILSSALIGKNCTCIGHHITGLIGSSPLILAEFDTTTPDSDSSSSLSTVKVVGIILGTNIFAIVLTAIICTIIHKNFQRTDQYTINDEPHHDLETTPSRCVEAPEDNRSARQVPPSSPEDNRSARQVPLPSLCSASENDTIGHDGQSNTQDSPSSESENDTIGYDGQSNTQVKVLNTDIESLKDERAYRQQQSRYNDMNIIHPAEHRILNLPALTDEIYQVPSLNETGTYQRS